MLNKLLGLSLATAVLASGCAVYPDDYQYDGRYDQDRRYDRDHRYDRDQRYDQQRYDQREWERKRKLSLKSKHVFFSELV